MKKLSLRQIIFAALCCDLGLISKKLISPGANVITEALHIPGGIATSFSLMFLVVASALLGRFGCGILMALVQSVLAFSFGMTGNMGLLAPIGYVVPGLVIDLCLWLRRKIRLPEGAGILAASVLSSVSACLTADLIVFHLRGVVLLVYVLVSASAGAVCSLLAAPLVRRLRKILQT
ncbi:MAG: hypothetical protein K6E92_03985 [Lachnospiraceae bacterium]|nr:hypothetical protein [Lachnospiraceae bacterium]